MHIKAVRYGRTVSRDYQSWKAEVEVELAPGDEFDDALSEAKRAVAFALQDQAKRAGQGGAPT